MNLTYMYIGCFFLGLAIFFLIKDTLIPYVRKVQAKRAAEGIILWKRFTKYQKHIEELIDAKTVDDKQKAYNTINKSYREWPPGIIQNKADSIRLWLLPRVLDIRQIEDYGRKRISRELETMSTDIRANYGKRRIIK